MPLPQPGLPQPVQDVTLPPATHLCHISSLPWHLLLPNHPAPRAGNGSGGVPVLLCWHSPINGVLVQLPELPVHGEDVHVVVLLKVPGQELHGVVTGLQALLVLMDLLHLPWERPGRPCQQGNGVQGGTLGGTLQGSHRSLWTRLPVCAGSIAGVSSQTPSPVPHLELLLLGQQVVVLVALVQGDQHVLEPVPHAQGELGQLCVQAGRDDCKSHTAVSAASGHAAPHPGHAAPVPSHLSPEPARTFALPQTVNMEAVPS